MKSKFLARRKTYPSEKSALGYDLNWIHRHGVDDGNFFVMSKSLLEPPTMHLQPVHRRCQKSKPVATELAPPGTLCYKQRYLSFTGMPMLKPVGISTVRILPKTSTSLLIMRYPKESKIYFWRSDLIIIWTSYRRDVFREMLRNTEKRYFLVSTDQVDVQLTEIRGRCRAR